VLLYLVAQSCPTLCHPMNYSPPGSSAHGIFQTRILEWVAMPFSRDLPNPGIESMSPALQTDSLLSEPPGKPKNTGVGSLFPLLQGIFLPQESNQGLLHCRRILYQLSYQGSLESSIEIPLKSRNEATIQPSKSTTGHILSENQNRNRHMYPNVHCSTT